MCSNKHLYLSHSQSHIICCHSSVVVFKFYWFKHEPKRATVSGLKRQDQIHIIWIYFDKMFSFPLQPTGCPVKKFTCFFTIFYWNMSIANHIECYVYGYGIKLLTDFAQHFSQLLPQYKITRLRFAIKSVNFISR